MTQNEKVTVKLTLEMDVKTALTTFDGCKTAEDIVDCMVEELSDQFRCTGSGLTITEAAIIRAFKKEFNCSIDEALKLIESEVEHDKRRSNQRSK